MSLISFTVAITDSWSHCTISSLQECTVLNQTFTTSRPAAFPVPLTFSIYTSWVCVWRRRYGSKTTWCNLETIFRKKKSKKLYGFVACPLKCSLLDIAIRRNVHGSLMKLFYLKIICQFLDGMYMQHIWRNVCLWGLKIQNT